jgi:regulator of nucleoside diphosphate kinase
MGSDKRKHRKPVISMSHTDHAQLTRLAESFAAQNEEVSDLLFAELDRARVVPDGQLRHDVVRMGSTLRFSSDSGEDRTVTLVYPGEADIAEGKISIMTPIGASLIGLAAGQSMDWTARDGRVHRLTVESVVNQSDDPGASPKETLRAAS